MRDFRLRKYKYIPFSFKNQVRPIKLRLELIVRTVARLNAIAEPIVATPIATQLNPEVPESNRAEWNDYLEPEPGLCDEESNILSQFKVFEPAFAKLVERRPELRYENPLVLFSRLTYTPRI